VISGGLFGEQGLPGVFFTYELSPMMVKYTERQRWGHLMILLLL